MEFLPVPFKYLMFSFCYIYILMEKYNEPSSEVQRVAYAYIFTSKWVSLKALRQNLVNTQTSNLSFLLKFLLVNIEKL